MKVNGFSMDLSAAGRPGNALREIDSVLETARSPFLMTEEGINQLWSQAMALETDSQTQWLIRVRLAETALLCAGNYADGCEYQAAGDFLVNPRQITFRRMAGGGSVVKRRHGRLSDQLGIDATNRLKSLRCLASGGRLETTQPPLLPHMTQVLKQSGRVAPAFIHRLETGQCRIADALAFLAAWQIFDAVGLQRRLQAAPPHEKAFAESCLCRFDTEIFQRIEDDLRRGLRQPDYRSAFLTWPLDREYAVKPATRSRASLPVSLPA